MNLTLFIKLVFLLIYVTLITTYLKQYSRHFCLFISEFVKAFIDFPKPLIGLVNGPAIGIAVTTLGLCDVVYATDKVCRIKYMDSKSLGIKQNRRQFCSFLGTLSHFHEANILIKKC